MQHGRFYLWAVAQRWRADAAVGVVLYVLCCLYMGVVIVIAVGVGMAVLTLPSCHAHRDDWRKHRDADPARAHGSPRDVS